MDKDELNREYSPSSCVDDITVHTKKYSSLSDKAYHTLSAQCQKDIFYSTEKRSHMDIFIPDGAIGPYPVHIFIHGGYWQELSKAESTFAAPNFLDHNIIFIALDYTLATDASVAEIVRQVRQAMLWALENISEYNGDPENIILSGSSAGAHLVAEIVSMDWGQEGYNDCPLKAACEVSGIYDLRPLVQTYVNDALGLTPQEATRLSPQFHIPKQACPVIFSCGGNETSEFKRQTSGYMAAWQKAGHKAEFVAMPAFNHFDIILELNNPNSPLFKAILTQILRKEPTA